MNKPKTTKTNKIDLILDEIRDIKHNVKAIEESQSKLWTKHVEMDQKLGIILDQVVTSNERSKLHERVLNKHTREISNLDVRVKVIEKHY